MAEKKVRRKKCSECGGPRRGRHAHKPSCSQYKGSKAKRGMVSLDIASLGKMDIAELAELFAEISAFGETISAELQKRLQEMRDRNP